MSENIGPAVARERLRTRLRELREEAALSTESVAAAMYWSLSKLNRIETGAVTISAIEVKSLANHYGVTNSEELTMLMSLAKTSRERSWWSSHKLTKEYQQFVAYEAEASRVSVYHSMFVPGLLQTQDYAKAITAGILRKDQEDDDVAARVEVRLNRQRDFRSRLGGSNPPELVAALDEAVLRRPVGGNQVMVTQIDHLLELHKRPSITLIVIPLTLGEHPGLGGTFELLEFAGHSDPDVLFVESAAQDFVEKDVEVTQNYRENMRILAARGLIGAAANDAILDARRLFTR